MIVQFDTTFTLYVCWIHFAILYYISVNACFGLFMDVNLYDYPIISQNETCGIDFCGTIKNIKTQGGRYETVKRRYLEERRV